MNHIIHQIQKNIIEGDDNTQELTELEIELMSEKQKLKAMLNEDASMPVRL